MERLIKERMLHFTLVVETIGWKIFKVCLNFPLAWLTSLSEAGVSTYIPAATHFHNQVMET